MGVKFGMPNFTPIGATRRPCRVKKPQNRPLSKLNTGGLRCARVVGSTKAIDNEKLSQLGYTTDRNSYWLANVARLLDAILTPGQRTERDLSYGRSCDRKNDLLPILQNVTY